MLRVYNIKYKDKMKPMRALMIIILSISYFLVSGQNKPLQGRIENFNFNKKQEISDTIPLVEYVKSATDANQPAYFINGKFINPSVVTTLDPTLIDSIHIEKKDIVINDKKYDGQLHLFMKDEYHPQFISLSDLKLKYLKQLYRPTIFIIDNNIVKYNYEKYLIDEKYILKIIVDSVVNAEQNLNIDIVKLVTKTEENIKEAEKIMIRGAAEAD